MNFPRTAAWPHFRPLVATLIAVASVTCWGQRLVVQTTARMVTGETTRTSLHSIDFADASGVALPYHAGSTIPGGLPRLVVDGAYVVAVSTPSSNARISTPRYDRSYLELVRVSPLFLPHRRVRVASEPGEKWSLLGVADAGRFPAALVSSHGQDVEELFVYPLKEERGRLLAGQPTVVNVPGSVTYAQVFGEDVWLQGFDSAKGEVFVARGKLGPEGLRIEAQVSLSTSGIAGSQPAGFCRSRDGGRLAVMVSGYVAFRASGERSSWIYTLDGATLQPEGSPIRIAGTKPAHRSGVQNAQDDSIWVATRAPGADHGNITRLDWSDTGLDRSLEHSFYGISTAPIIATDLQGGAVLIAAERRLSIIEETGKVVELRRFEAPIRVVSWIEGDLFVGEGGRLHKVNPLTGESLDSIQFNSGFVSAILLRRDPPEPVPHKPSTFRTGGIQDRLRESLAGTGKRRKSDPDPSLPPIPDLNITSAISFYGESVQQELKTISLDLPGAEGAKWTVNYDHDAMSWLGVVPESGTVPDTAYLLVYPSRYQPESAVYQSGFIDIDIRGFTEELGRINRSIEIEVRVVPPRGLPRRILWIWPEPTNEDGPRDGGEPQSLRPLARILAAPPSNFAHHDSWGPTTRPLGDYSVVVLTASAAANGAVTRQEILDYAADGGALLLIGAANNDAGADAFSRWLAPLGVSVDKQQTINGTFASDSKTGLGRFWESFSIRDGAAFHVTNDNAVVVPGPEGSAILAHFDYGLGRIAIMSSATPLSDYALGTESNRRFAHALFRWLAQARQSIRDQDQDGLPDSIEDRNANGIFDSAETNFRDPDTDNDGIRDDLEDFNRNGAVEEGESSPINADTDGDGIHDGADASPLPDTGAIYLAGIEMEDVDGQAKGPSEGGQRVLFHGRNFDSQTEIWFGEVPSGRVRYLNAERLIAEVPPHPDPKGGVVTLRAERKADGQSAELASGYRYAPRSRAELTLRGLRTTLAANDVYRGTMQLDLDLPANVDVGDATFFIAVDPPDALASLRLEPNAQLLRQGRSVNQLRVQPGLWKYSISQPTRYSSVGDIGTLVWRVRSGSNPPLFRCEIDEFAITSASGLSLEAIEGDTMTVHLRNEIPRATP